MSFIALATSLHGESRFQANYHGATYVVRKAKGNHPLVVLENNKEVVPELNSMTLVNLPPETGQAAPKWIFVDRDTVKSSSMVLAENQSTPLNNEFHLKFYLESTLPLKNVFAVIYIETESGAKGCLVQDAGNMKAFSTRTIAFDMNLARNPGKWTYFVHLFSDGFELRHQLLDQNEFNRQISVAIRTDPVAKNKTESPVPYITFPPRGTGRSKDKVTVDLSISRNGSVGSAKVRGDIPPKLADSILEAVRFWWFIPGTKAEVNQSFSVVIDLSKLDEWSNESVHLTPAVDTPAKSLAQ